MSMDVDGLDDVLRASETLNADINFGGQVPALRRDIVQVRPLSVSYSVPRKMAHRHIRPRAPYRAPICQHP